MWMCFLVAFVVFVHLLVCANASAPLRDNDFDIPEEEEESGEGAIVMRKSEEREEEEEEEEEEGENGVIPFQSGGRKLLSVQRDIAPQEHTRQ